MRSRIWESHSENSMAADEADLEFTLFCFTAFLLRGAVTHYSHMKLTIDSRVIPVEISKLAIFLCTHTFHA